MMNECEYLSALLEALAPQGPRAAEDAAESFQQYLDFMRGEGYSDEEILHRLGTPEEFAGRVMQGNWTTGENNGVGSLMICTAVLATLFVALGIIMLIIASGSVLSWLSSIALYGTASIIYPFAVLCASSAAMLAAAGMTAVLLVACRAVSEK